MTEAAVGPDWAWNTWDPRYPGAMVHLPTGLTVRLSAFSAKANAYTDFAYSEDIRLGPRAADGSWVELELPHAGSRLLVRFAKPTPDTVVGDVQAVQLGEWGLRFWILLELGGERARTTLLRDGDPYVDPPVATARAGRRVAALASSTAPVRAYLYQDRLAAKAELESEGYYSAPPPRERGRWAQLRFAATSPRFGFAVHIGDSEEAAVAEARRAAAAAEKALDEGTAVAAAGSDRHTARRDAVRDVVAWNTVWDPVNARPYTVATRSWAPEKFGGWFVWLSDAFYAAILAAHAGDPETAGANLDAALANATPDGDGCLAGLLSGRTRWIDRSQLPIGAHATWVVHRLTGDRGVLERAYPVLRRAFDWWFEARDGNGNGLLEPGSSPVGDGHFVHTKQAALDEAAMDNSPIYDEATFDPTAHTLDVEDVALNSQLVLEAETLARIAGELGRPEDQAALRERAGALAALVRERLWDPERRIFANRLWDGRFVRSLAPTSFYPMAAGIAAPDQAETLVNAHLTDPWKFGGEHPVAGTPFDDPAAGDNVYWRGRVWPTMNYLVWLGLVRYGYQKEARDLAERGWRMFAGGWAERRCWENLNQRTGEGGDSSDSDGFYTWGALLAAIGDEALAEAFTSTFVSRSE